MLLCGTTVKSEFALLVKRSGLEVSEVRDGAAVALAIRARSVGRCKCIRQRGDKRQGEDDLWLCWLCGCETHSVGFLIFIVDRDSGPFRTRQQQPKFRPPNPPSTVTNSNGDWTIPKLGQG